MKSGSRIKNYLDMSERVFSTIIKVLSGLSISIYLYIIIGLITVYNRVSNYANEVVNYSYLKITKTLSLIEKESFINYLSENFNSVYWGEIKNSLMSEINGLNSKVEIISYIKQFCSNKSEAILNEKHISTFPES